MSGTNNPLKIPLLFICLQRTSEAGKERGDTKG